MSEFRGKTLAAGHLAKGMKRELDRGVLTSVLRRHAMVVDQKTESVVVPLNTTLSSQGKLELANSMWFLR
jgi:probable 2-oxoglutarate dehydrogenase E1 component DHKTD1